ncbi:MAG TPA: 50S ribosomal protein L4 [Cytophagaceae bacterium]|jgi:large subunit ribosomal protein L4|nr:50S ribosomal protein L4 [Cytophagaceae bacterium]
MELSVINIKGKDTGRKVSLSDAVFAIEPNDHAIYLDVKQHLANKRQGTHKTKEKAEVSYSTKKLKKQKGTGGARAGSRKSPVFVGGGTVFGPKPRDYSFKLNKKVKSLARQSAVAHKLKENSISVLENFKMDVPKTKEFLAILTQLSLLNKKTLFVLPEVDKNIVLSSRNISRAKVVTVNDLNTYEVLNADKLIVAESAVQKLEALLN